MTLWTIIIVGLCTYALRSSLLLAPRGEQPNGIRRALRRVPAAILPLLVVSTMMAGADRSGFELRLAAAAIAAAVAWRTRSVGATLAVGMVALWVLEALR